MPTGERICGVVTVFDRSRPAQCSQQGSLVSMEILLRWVFFSALALLPLSCWQRDKFPAQMPVLPPVTAAPIQASTATNAFSVALHGVDYHIQPVFDYELHGIVVSLRHHNADRMLHERWQDHLNIADLCVIWGANAQAPDLNAFEFWNGQFTCFFRTESQQAWQRFDRFAISNNHLLTEAADLREQIAKVQVGDQIRLLGQLANYSNSAGFDRATSTVRNDEGNGACETIYVRDFRILRSMTNPWRSLHSISWAALLLAAGTWLALVMTGRLRHRASN
jgi:hypothetical protein